MINIAAFPTTQPTTAPAIVPPETVSEELLDFVGIGVGGLENELSSG
jgi:hypothetical protein